MRVLTLVGFCVLGESAVAQSVSLGLDRKSVFSAVEYPAWDSPLFGSPDWGLGMDGFLGTRVNGSKWLGVVFSVERRFYTFKLFGVPAFKVFYRAGIGEELFAGAKPRPALIFGIEGKG